MSSVSISIFNMDLKLWLDLGLFGGNGNGLTRSDWHWIPAFFRALVDMPIARQNGYPDPLRLWLIGLLARPMDVASAHQPTKRNTHQSASIPKGQVPKNTVKFVIWNPFCSSICSQSTTIHLRKKCFRNKHCPSGSWYWTRSEFQRWNCMNLAWSHYVLLFAAQCNAIFSMIRLWCKAAMIGKKQTRLASQSMRWLDVPPKTAKRLLLTEGSKVLFAPVTLVQGMWIAHIQVHNGAV